MQSLFSRSELVSFLRLPERTLTYHLKQLNDAGLFSFSGKNAANGRPEKLYKLEDLPKRWQRKIADANAGYNPAQQTKISGSGAMDEASGLGNEKSLAVMPDQSSKNSEITNRPFKIAKQNTSQEQKHSDPAATAAVSGAVSAAPAAGLSKIGNKNADVMNEVVRFGGTVKENTMLSCVADIENRSGSVKEAIEAASRTYGVSRATIYNWIKAVKGNPQEENCQVAVFGEQKDFTVKTTTTSNEAVEYMVGTYLQNLRVTKQLIVERTIEKAAEAGWRVGTKVTLLRLLSEAIEQMRPAIALMQGGTQKFTKEYAPLMRRSLTCYKPLDLIVGDQHIFDYLVTVDGKVCRPECYMWFDMGSRMALGFHGTFGHYNSGDVAAALLEACRFGIPKGIYTDMGKPELSNYVKMIAQNLTVLSTVYEPTEEFNIPDMDELVDSEGAAQFFRIESVEHKVAIGRRPNSKPIEGYFAILERKLYDITGGIGYCKRVADPDENLRIIAAAEKNKRQMKLLTYEEFFEYVFEVLRWWNSHEVSTDKIVPEKWFFENLGNNPVIDDRNLEFMLFPEKVCTVRQSKIKLNGLEYYNPKLANYSGSGNWEHRVLVKYSPSDPERVHIFSYETKGRKRQYLGMGELYEKVDPRNDEQVGARMEAQKSLEKYWRTFANEMKTKGESLQKQSTARLALDDAAEEAAKAEEAKKRVDNIKKKVSQKEADLIFLGKAE